MWIKFEEDEAGEAARTALHSLPATEQLKILELTELLAHLRIPAEARLTESGELEILVRILKKTVQSVIAGDDF